VNRVRYIWVAIAVVAALSIAALVVAIDAGINDNEGEQGQATPASNQVTVKVNEEKGDGAPTTTLKVPKPVVTAVQSSLESGLRDETPSGTTPDQVDAIQKAADKIKATLPPLPTAGATQGVPGCRTEFVANQSSRLGVRPTQFWLHYTVSHNIAGWADVNAIVKLFDTPSFQASSNFVLDGEGNCAYIVPIENKAWAQAGANRFAISFEIIDYGNESTYLPPAGMKKLQSVLQVLSQRTGIPLVRGAVSNCTPVKSGIVHHYDGGICAGGHHDIQPFNIDTVVKQIAAGARPSKKTVWVRHRLAVHNTYTQKCKHAYQRQRRPVTCASLRSQARKLDALIKREG
jgi:hypothetical protein